MNKTSFTDSFLIFTFILFFLLFSGEMLFCQIEQLNTENLKRENGIELLFQNRIPVLFSPQTTIFDRKDDEKFSYKNSFPDKQYRRIFSDTVLFHPVSGPYGGTVRSIAHDSGGWLFVATDGEVYRSKDNGLHWNMKLFPSQLHNYVEPITILGPNVIVAETDYNNYISTDRGESWDYLTDDVHGFTVETTGNIYAGSNYGGAKISIDTAKTWQQFALTGKKIWEVVLCGDGKFACPADSGIYYSSDKGITWKYKPYDTRFTWNLVSDKKGHLFVLKFFGQNFQLYKSSDFGESWQQIILGEWEDAYRIYVEEDGRLFVTTNERILISINAGETWEELAFPIGMPLTVGRDTAENLLAGSFEGLYRLNNISGEWEELNNGIHARRIEAIEFTSTGSILVISLGTCFRSTDFGNSWTVVELESNIRVYPYSPILSTSRGVIFIAACFDNYSECGLLRSTDDGVTWERISVLSNYYAIYEITEGSCGDILVATAYGDIYRSTDNGDCWYKVVSSHNQLEITALAADDLGNYYAAQDTSLLISQNGITWKEFTMSRGYASHESISIDNRNEIYFGSSSDGVYHSTDYGRTWNLLNNGLFEKYVISTTSDDSGNVVLGTSKGIFRLADSSNSWIWFSKGFPNTFAMSLSFSQNNFLFAGTQDFGMYRSIDPLEKRIPIIDQPPTININNFLLYQNYPNPFNDQTIIRYKVPFYSEIKIRIYNILGQMITTLFSGTLTKGVYSANWIPKVQSSGLYFCLMSATSGTKTYQKTIKILYLR